MILEELRRATRDRHERIEARFEVARPGLTRTAYRDALGRLWGFYAPCEPRLEAIPGSAELGLDLPVRRKSPLLRRDLRLLGMAEAGVDALPVFPFTAPTEPCGIPELLGTLYVLEGATLGGRIIVGHLTRTLKIDAGSGAAFFASYGERVAARWREFLAALTASTAAADGAGRYRIIAAACAAFDRFETWVCGSEAAAL